VSGFSGLCRALDIADYCREIETYLCRKNDGHLIRVVGPSFDLVSGWASRGVPLKIAYAGIDRYFERYYRKGPRRRPVKIDFCEADVLDVFDEWRRAVGMPESSVVSRQSSVDDHEASVDSHDGSVAGHEGPVERRRSLPAHLERVLVRLSSARASGALGGGFDEVIDRVSAELDAARAKAGGRRGAARAALVERLETLDDELLQRARAALDLPTMTLLERDAEEELAAFRVGMAPEAFARARVRAVDRLVRERFGLPTIRYE
jgi:hypothetical protein